MHRRLMLWIQNIHWLIENLLFQHEIVYLLKQREFHRFRSFGLTIQSFYLRLLRNKNNEIDPSSMMK